MNLADYLNQPGMRAADLAAKLKIPSSLLSQWKTAVRVVPAERCPGIERATNGAVTCEELRPDVDWGYLRATPAPIEKILTTTRAQLGLEAKEGA